jgi:RNA polymerase sigma-70 factor (ECF subfamily)
MKEEEQIKLKDIIERAKSGDKSAFSEIYQKYFIPIYRYVYFRVGNKEDAEDITQEVFTKAYVSFDKFKLEAVSPLAYFYTIARNSVIDLGRKKKNSAEASDLLDEFDSKVLNPEEVSAKKEESKMLLEAIGGGLSESEQDVILMKFFDGLSNKEIASILEKEEGAVRQLQSRGLRDLRDILLKLNAKQ